MLGTTNIKLSRLVLDIFRFFEKYEQNLNKLENNSVSWDLRLGFNWKFKGIQKTSKFDLN
jgi:hypothetical protein